MFAILVVSKIANALCSDFSINCPTYYIASSLATKKVPTYKQVFNAGTQIHGAIGPYLSELDPTVNTTLASAVKDWWASFVVHSNPNTQSWGIVTKPFWPGYEVSGEVMSVDFTELGIKKDVEYDDTERCSFFWNNGKQVQN